MKAKGRLREKKFALVGGLATELFLAVSPLVKMQILFAIITTKMLAHNLSPQSRISIC